jgi:hypothetical protein
MPEAACDRLSANPVLLCCFVGVQGGLNAMFGGVRPTEGHCRPSFGTGFPPASEGTTGTMPMPDGSRWASP